MIEHNLFFSVCHTAGQSYNLFPDAKDNETYAEDSDSQQVIEEREEAFKHSHMLINNVK